MNDLSANRYLLKEPVPLDKYDLFTFFYNDLAVETRTAPSQIAFAVGSLLAFMRFDIHVFGFTLLNMLVSCYIVKPDYDLAKTVSYLADINGVSDTVAVDAMQAAISHNTHFVELARGALGRPPILGGKTPTIAEAVEILGAIFKVYYNYTSEETVFDFELEPRINLYKIGVNYGDQR